MVSTSDSVRKQMDETALSRRSDRSVEDQKTEMAAYIGWVMHLQFAEVIKVQMGLKGSLTLPGLTLELEKYHVPFNANRIYLQVKSPFTHARSASTKRNGYTYQPDRCMSQCNSKFPRI